MTSARREASGPIRGQVGDFLSTEQFRAYVITQDRRERHAAVGHNHVQVRSAGHGTHHWKPVGGHGAETERHVIERHIARGGQEGLDLVERTRAVPGAQPLVGEVNSVLANLRVHRQVRWLR